MSSKITSQRFVQLVRQSELIEGTALDAFLGGVQLEATDAEQLCARMREANLLTSWQSRQLLSGKWRGFVLGKYRLLRELGKGGMGKVFLAEHVVMRRLVAIKILPPDRTNSPGLLERFHQEARAAAAVDHPNVVRAFDIDNAGGAHFLVMEYVEGEDLQLVVQNGGPLPCEEAARCVVQAARGLGHAHQAGLVHRDVKPANLLLDKGGRVKVLDLGLARVSDEREASLTVAYDQTVGTVDYQSPEQAIDSHNLDGRADIYSLGCTLYYLLTGRPPFPEGTLAQRVMRHQIAHPKPITEFRQDAPRWLIEVQEKMTAKKVGERPASMAAVIELLEAGLALPREALVKREPPSRATASASAPSNADMEEISLLEDLTPAARPPSPKVQTAGSHRPAERPLPRARPLVEAESQAPQAGPVASPSAESGPTSPLGSPQVATLDAFSALWEAAMSTPMPDASTTFSDAQRTLAPPSTPGAFPSAPSGSRQNAPKRPPDDAEDGSAAGLPSSVWALIAVGVLLGGLIVTLFFSWLFSFSSEAKPKGVEVRGTDD